MPPDFTYSCTFGLEGMGGAYFGAMSLGGALGCGMLLCPPSAAFSGFADVPSAGTHMQGAPGDSPFCSAWCTIWGIIGMPGCIIIMPGCIWTGTIICMPPWKDTH